MNPIKLIKKYFECPKSERRDRTYGFIKSKIKKHAWPLYIAFLDSIVHGDFYIQQRPYYDLGEAKCPQIRELEDLWNKGRPFEKDNSRLYFLYMIINCIIERGLSGAVAEVGVYRGHTAAVLHRLLPEKRLYLFDTFQGFSGVDLRIERSMGGVDEKVGHFGDTTIQLVMERIGNRRNVVLCPGLFPETVARVAEGEPFCLVHFDADLYQPARATCEYFFPRLVDWGIMIFHDYNNRWVGVRRAVDEYFAGSGAFIFQIPDRFGTAVIVKTPVIYK